MVQEIELGDFNHNFEHLSTAFSTLLTKLLLPKKFTTLFASLVVIVCRNSLVLSRLRSRHCVTKSPPPNRRDNADIENVYKKEEELHDLGYLHIGCQCEWEHGLE